MIRVLPNGDDINGILHRFPYMNATCQSKSIKHNFSQCINAINISHDYHFSSLDEENEWLLVHIPNVKLYATHYTIQVPDRDFWQWFCPKSWDFYAIVENNEILIDHVEEAGFKDNDKIKTFEINKKGYYSQFKLIMKGTNEGGELHLRIYKIDLFGIIYSFIPFFHQNTTYHILHCFYTLLFVRV